jgi:hypothetical protein
MKPVCACAICFTGNAGTRCVVQARIQKTWIEYIAELARKSWLTDTIDCPSFCHINTGGVLVTKIYFASVYLFTIFAKSLDRAFTMIFHVRDI